MFYLPKGWVPYYAEWLLSFPRAPLGSVSIQAWALACGAVILLVSDAVVAVVALGDASKEGVKTPREKMAMGSQQAQGEKKEL